MKPNINARVLCQILTSMIRNTVFLKKAVRGVCTKVKHSFLRHQNLDNVLMDRQKGLNFHSSLEVFKGVIGGLDSNLLSEKSQVDLKKYQECIEFSKNLRSDMDSKKETSDLTNECMDQLNLPNSRVIIPCGWYGQDSHAVTVQIDKDKGDNYNVRLINTGSGSEKHAPAGLNKRFAKEFSGNKDAVNTLLSNLIEYDRPEKAGNADGFYDFFKYSGLVEKISYHHYKLQEGATCTCQSLYKMLPKELRKEVKNKVLDLLGCDQDGLNQILSSQDKEKKISTLFDRLTQKPNMSKEEKETVVRTYLTQKSLDNLTLDSKSAEEIDKIYEQLYAYIMESLKKNLERLLEAIKEDSQLKDQPVEVHTHSQNTKITANNTRKGNSFFNLVANAFTRVTRNTKYQKFDLTKLT